MTNEKTNGVDRCHCGCKYWEGGRCIDCGGTEVVDDEPKLIESKATGRWFEVERTDGVVVSGFAGYKRQRFGYLTEDRQAVEAWVRGETDHIR